MASSNPSREVRVKLPGGGYPVWIGEGLLEDALRLSGTVRGAQILIVTNTTVAPLYLEPVRGAFSDRQCDVVVLEDGEQFKNRNSLAKVHDALAAGRHHRDTTVVALGGGVVGDIAGFAASTWLRGVAVVQIPTTLLAQVDASIGGKTAINHAGGKNLLGTFHQPAAVICDVATLKTLSTREFRAGLAEVVKYALLTGGQMLDRLSGCTVSELMADPKRLSELVAECCSIKAGIVERDATEQGERALLNLGHTIGHALEACTGYTRYLHGEAVATGLYCAALLSEREGLLAPSEVLRVERLLSQFGLPSRIPADIAHDALMNQLYQDKKIINNCLRFVLMHHPGNCFVSADISEKALRAVLAAATEGENS
ncbi:3-dehydroquinate synthase [Legionella geestiana]|uniref:3-dehydroquinate synthase n=1 Tax=Legionella geestiana TaxID=45065 RepID=UPI0010922A2C|nr:3-dehydroquinate synthase [Legionella geestiana]QDQ39122.1 3-dehydroquinate synthase [Legionella geestiana]